MILHHQIQGHTIPIEVISSTRSRNVRLSYRPGQTIRATFPRWVKQDDILKYIKHYDERILKQHLHKSDSLLEGNTNLTDHSRQHYLSHHQAALEFCIRKVQQWNQELGRTYSSITVKSLKSKWGSCSSRGNLTFNYKLMFLPEPMADYVIVHELCHLKQMNHGPAFWQLVEAVYGPERKKWRKIR